MRTLTNELADVVANVFSATLSMEICDIETASKEADTKDITYIGILQITGEFCGTALLELNESVAARATSKMLGLSPEQIEQNDIEDVVSELANMVAGNLKAMLPPPSNLSLPVVARGIGATVRMPEAEEVSVRSFLCEADPITVRLFQKSRH